MKDETAVRMEKGLVGGLTLALIIFLFSPAPTVMVAAVFAILGILVASLHISDEKNYVHLQNIELKSGAFNLAPAAISAVLTLIIGIFLGRIILADYFYAQSLVAAAANQGTQTYNLQIKAIGLNPDNDSYHVAYSQTNLALADALASQPNLTDQQKQAVVTLVQQAIREGRTATDLAPRRSANWENLSLIYRSLINFAQGADQWTEASLNQAINFDPTNPRLRLDLGGIYFAAQDYSTAAQLFNQAVSLKSDYANAHYNLAEAMKNLKMNSQAISELQLTASLICQTSSPSSDCDQVNKEINNLSSPAATPSAVPVVATPSAQPKLATSSAVIKPLPKVATPIKLGTPSGQITP